MIRPAPFAISCAKGVVRNAVNFPSVTADELQRLQPWLRLAEGLAAVVSQMGPARVEQIGVRYYGALADSRAAELLASSAAAGVLRPILSGGVSVVNARAAAKERGIEIVETRSSRSRDFASLVSLKLHTERRRALGGRHRVRAEQPAAGVGARHQRRGAAHRLIVVGDDQHRAAERRFDVDAAHRHQPRAVRLEHRAFDPALAGVGVQLDRDQAGEIARDACCAIR